VHFVDDGGDLGQSTHDQGGQLPTQVKGGSSDVEQKVTWRGYGPVRIAVERLERVEFGRSRASEESVPCC